MGRWHGAGTSNTYARLDDADPNDNFTNPSNFYLQNGAFLRLRTVQIGYNVPRQYLQHIGVQNVRIFIGGNNLYTFTKYQGYDPEIGGNQAKSEGNANNYGVDNVIYPTARSYTVGLNVGF
jgi:hypothetical protein